ncbi:unnamed protein product [Lactuca saligna]|uniref:Uncharacterized protein n=1 Tax=Lactuca saligna TaxID=75948 RepID=A0AA36ELK3_LACSI|nr:unnamed protein product [Lactuca saligna]
MPKVSMPLLKMWNIPIRLFVRTEIQADNDELQSFIASRLAKLQDDLVIENSLLDKLEVKTKKIKVLSVQLSLAQQQNDELKSKKLAFETRGEVKKLVYDFGEQEQKPTPNDLKGNEASGSKGKGKLIDDEEDEGEKLKRKSHDKDLDEYLRITREVDARDAQVTLETQKILFPHWTVGGL